MGTVAILPGQLRVRSSFVRRSYAAAALSFLLGLGFAIGFPAWQISEAKGIIADKALWASGTPALDASVHGKETSHNFLLNSYDLQVEYATAEGELHEQKIKFDTLFVSVDKNAPVDVHYDPKDPSRMVLSWSVDMTGGRWAAVVFMGAIGLFGLLFLWAARVQVRNVSDAREAETRFEETDVPLVRLIEMKQYGRSTGVMRYQFHVAHADGTTKKREVSFNFKKNQQPIFVDASRTRMLAVKTTMAPDRPIVLRNDLYPFEVSDSERAEIDARVKQRVAEPG
jgi:hypothetical protein